MPKDAAPAVSQIAALSTAELGARFRTLYGAAPPKHLRRELLCRAVAHRLQEAAQGGSNPALHRRLRALAADLRRTGRISLDAPRPAIKPGTRLLRDWRGETHAVTVLADGFLYRGARYRSLSQIARTITGTRWSGPAFFGLHGRAAR